MKRIASHTLMLTRHALDVLCATEGLTVYGPGEAENRASLVAFNAAGWNPIALAEALNASGIESRGGCHCATLAHHDLRLEPPASCRLSFYLYNTADEVRYAVNTLKGIVQGRKSLAERHTARARMGI